MSDVAVPETGRRNAGEKGERTQESPSSQSPVSRQRRFDWFRGPFVCRATYGRTGVCHVPLGCRAIAKIAGHNTSMTSPGGNSGTDFEDAVNAPLGDTFQAP